MELIPHLLERHYDVHKYINQVIDQDNNILTVYLNDLSGRFIGYQQYNPNTDNKRTNNPKEARYFTYRTPGCNALWGLETLDLSKGKCYVVEGIFKASSLHMLGHNAIAVLTNNPKPLVNWMYSMPLDFTAIGDNDKAGLQLITTVGRGMQLDKDVDEYPLQELRQLLGDSNAHRSTYC